MSDFSRIKAYMRVRAPSVPDPLMDIAIRDAVSDFCESTRLWRFKDTISTIGDDEVLTGEDSHSNVFEIESCRFNGIRIDPITIAELDESSSDWQLDTGTPKFFTQLEPDTIRLYPLADTAADLILNLYLRPSQTCTVIPDWMTEKYYEVIGDCAIGKVVGIKGRAFYDADLALYHQDRFETKVSKLKRKVLRGQQRAPIKTKARFM